MPPKPKFTREEIVDASIELVREEGIENLTARVLAKKLGCSPQPIFTVFEDMTDLKKAVIHRASEILSEFSLTKTDEIPTFKEAGMALVLFALKEPNLFKMAYMFQERPLSFEEAFDQHGGAPEGFIDFITKAHDITPEEARVLFQNTWVFTYGLGMLCATGMCTFTEKEASEKLSQSFLSTLMFIKSGGLRGEIPFPRPKGMPTYGNPDESHHGLA